MQKDLDNKKDKTNISQSTVAIDDLCFLANRYVDQRLYDEAIRIYELATQIFPDNLALKINLGRVKSLKNQSLSKVDDFTAKQQEFDSRAKNFFNKFQGLGEIYSKIGRKSSSKHVFELTKLSNPDFYIPYLHLGKIFFEDKEYRSAIKELEVCTKLNPFSEEAYNYLALSYFYNGEHHKALIAMVDALLLSGDLVKDIPTAYLQKINLIVEKIEGFTPGMRNQLIKTRKEKLHALYEEMEKDIKSLVKQRSETVITKPEERVLSAEDENLFDLALKLKQSMLFRSLDDDTLIKIAHFSNKMEFLKDDYVFKENSASKGLYVILSGKVELRKNTPFGFLTLSKLSKGSFFGENDLITGSKHWYSAVSNDQTKIVLLERGGFAPLFAKNKTVAIHFLWYFWKSLSFQIRESNEKLKDFFESIKADKEAEGPRIGQSDKEIMLDIGKKMTALEGKGLSQMEMRLLATFSDSFEVKAGDTVFKEGEAGNKLFLIVEGEVIISKNIEGIGQEALTILKRGDFFGEMALLEENSRRSADAKAKVNTKLVGIKKETLKEILSIDSDSAYQFLSILCKILSHRLREINEKIYQWKMMQGGF